MVLLGLLTLAERPQAALQQDFQQVPAQAPWGPWVLLMGVVLAFVAVALFRRRDDDPVALLTVEGIVAAAVGLIPPWQWLMWFGLGPITGVLTGGFTGSLLVQVLGVAWLAIVVSAAMRRRFRAVASSSIEHEPGSRQIR